MKVKVKAEAKEILLALSVIALTLPVIFSGVLALKTNFAGDVGQKSAAITNIKKFCSTGQFFYGLGDYAYSTSVGSAADSAWKTCQSKRGVQGNHECVKSQSEEWAAATFGFSNCNQSSKSAINSNVAFVGINQYESYKVGSLQYSRVTTNLAKYNNMSNIDWIVVAYHEPGKGLGCGGSHCHGDNTNFYSIYEPIFKKYLPKILIVDAHTHLTGVGKINNVRTIQCGASGEGGTTLGSLHGFVYGSSKTGYCNVDFQHDKAIMRHISSSGQILHTHIFNK